MPETGIRFATTAFILGCFDCSWPVTGARFGAIFLAVANVAFAFTLVPDRAGGGPAGGFGVRMEALHAALRLGGGGLGGLDFFLGRS